jgi:small subunit ribosomal protein S9
MADQVEYYGTGRRKSAVARVFLRPGNGDIKINGKGFNEHFVTVAQRVDAMQPLVASDTTASFDAVINPELRAKLKAAGFLRRDPRGKERKKYGQKGARKRFQFSKR